MKNNEFNLELYRGLNEKYYGELFLDGKFIGNKHFGISIELYQKCISSDIPTDKTNPDLAYSFMIPFIEGKPADWRCVTGVTRKWQQNTFCKTGKVFVQSVRKLSKKVAIDLDFYRLFKNHWFEYNADSKGVNSNNTYPIFAHNKETNGLDGYIYPVKEFSLF